jgi:hypothetical protein
LAPLERLPLVVLLNGPPYAGKDTAAKIVARGWTSGADLVRVSDALKRIAHTLYGLPPDTPCEAFNHCKDEPRPEFGGKTPRSVYIWVSEVMVKPLLGEDWFGKVAAMKVRRAGGGAARIVSVPDSGFALEGLAMRDDLGAHNMLLLRIHAEARGCTFAGDSRSYIDVPGVHTADLYNDIQGDTRVFEMEVRREVISALGRQAAAWARLPPAPQGRTGD